MNSILDTVKEHCNVEPTDDSFDNELIDDTNAVFLILKELGVGPKEGFIIASSSDTWDDFIDDEIKVETVKSYVGKKVKLMFDPPTGSVLDSLERKVSELEWRLNVDFD